MTVRTAALRRGSPTRRAAAGWLVLLGAAIIFPYLRDSPTRGDDLVRYIVRVALLYYWLAAVGMLRSRPEDWAAETPRGRLIRAYWTLGWAAYFMHVGMAFHHSHHWSLAAAVRHVREVSGLGEGIYVSHLFTLAWGIDVLAWWSRPTRYAGRPAWLARGLHAFMAFVIFNATVVYETGLIRWAGGALFFTLAAMWLARRRAERGVGAAGGPQRVCIPPADSLHSAGGGG